MNLSDIFPKWLHCADYILDGVQAKPIDVNPYTGRFGIEWENEGALFPVGKIVTLQVKHHQVELLLKAFVSKSSPKGFIDLIFVATIESHAPFPTETVLDLEDVVSRPQAWAKHPFYFNLRVFFEVDGFVENGFTATLNGPTMIIYDTEFEVQLSLPGVDLLKLTARVESLDYSVFRPQNRCRLTFDSLSVSDREQISRYLALSFPQHLPSLKKVGLGLKSLDFAAQFRLALTPDQQQEVMQLRFLAHSAKPTGKTEALSLEKMRDAFDEHSVHLTLHSGKTLVGSTRLVFNGGDLGRSEIAQFVELPAWLIEKGFVELSRMVTLPDYQKMDVFSLLTQHVFRTCWQSGVQIALSDCEEHLLSAYEKRGAKNLGVSFIHPLEGHRLHVIYYDVSEIIHTGEKEMNWSAEMIEFVRSRKYISD